MNPVKRRTHAEANQGAALILALALLAIMAVMGTYYVRFTTLEQDAADLELAQTRARVAAEAGAHAVLGKLAQAWRAGATKVALGGKNRFEFPTYRRVRNAGGLDFAPQESRRAAAEVRITDESGRINLNHAPAPVLAAVLGVDDARAQQIASRIAGGGPGAWLAGPEDLVARGWLTKDEYAALDRTTMTAVSVADHANAAGCFNINAASPAAAAAALGVPVDHVAAMLGKGPFHSADALLRTVAGDSPGAAAPATALPPEAFSFRSHCFRIVSNGSYENVDERGVEYHRTAAHVETVVLFKDSGDFEILYWTAGRGRKDG